MEAVGDSWNSHQWHERLLEIEPGKPQLHRHCPRCGRDIVDDLWSGQRYAAHPAIFHFDRLAEEVTERWLHEPCPGNQLASDENDRRGIVFSELSGSNRRKAAGQGSK